MTATITRIARTARRALVATATRALALLAPEALAVNVPAPAAVVVPQAPKAPNYFAADKMPTVEEIAAAAALTEDTATRETEKALRAARTLLGRLPEGIYGPVTTGRKAATRRTTDLVSVAATYAALGLGPVPTVPVADSLTVALAEPAAPVLVAA